MKTFTQKEGKRGVLSYGLYSMYKKRFTGIDRKCEANVQYEKWRTICKRFNIMKMDSICNGVIFKLPYRLGSIGVIQKKIKIHLKKDGSVDLKKIGIDWDATIRLWHKLYPECKNRADLKKIANKPLCHYTNEHTDGKVFRFYWKKKYSTVKNKSAYSFTVVKQHRYRLKSVIDNNPSIQFCTKF